MALTNTKALTIRPFGVCDAIDGTNAPPGAMSQLVNLIPNPSTRNQYVPRPASVQATNFGSFTAPTTVTALLVIGNLAWGTISTGRNAGKDEPFCFNLKTSTFVTISNVTAANSPTSPATTGDWTPPIMASITATKIMITHPGYNFAGGYAVGWIDTSNFSSTTVTGSTHTSTTIDTLSANVLTVAGWQVGYQIAGAGIPANTYITAIAANGLSITISNAATASAGGVALTVTGGTVAAPLYGAGQTSPVTLAAQPVSVAQFNGRAYYALLNALTWSDSEIPTQITNASQTIILGDANPVTALSGLPVTSQLSGSITQNLVAFKGTESFYLITGDAATSNLSSNIVEGSVGTSAPLSICDTPNGLAFVAPDGLRIVSLYGVLSEPIGANGEGINLPFLYAINPTRMCMAYNQNILRVSVQNGFVNGQPVQEYWYHFSLKSWTGPHTFPAAVISAYAGTPAAGFVAAASGVNAALWTSTATPTNNSTYTENSVPLLCTYATVLLPDNNEGAMNSVVETTLAIAIPPGGSVNVLAADEIGGVLNQLILTGPAGGNTIWGSFTWGAYPWGGANAIFQQVPLQWDQPLVFKQMSIMITTQAAASLVIGNIYEKYEVLGYNYAPPI